MVNTFILFEDPALPYLHRILVKGVLFRDDLRLGLFPLTNEHLILRFPFQDLLLLLLIFGRCADLESPTWQITWREVRFDIIAYRLQ